MSPEAARRARSLGIATFLLLQIAVPLRWYACGRGSDERFAWRMFSTRSGERCEVRVDEAVSEGGERRRRAVHLPSEVAGVWIALLESGRPQVVHKVLARRCERPGVETASFWRDCVAPDGRALAPIRSSLDCASGELRSASGGS